MRDVVQSYANDMLSDHLGLTISVEETDAYCAFCRQANSDLVRNSLKELKGFAKSAKKMAADGKPTPPLLPKLTRIYFRKVEEQARLFTALSIFETAYRVHLATWMEHHFGVKKWWEPIYATVRAGNPCTDIKHINGVALSPAAASAIDKLLKGIDGYDLSGAKIARQSSGHDLLCHSKLSDLEEIIKEQWVQFKRSLGDQNPALATAASFLATFKRIREARNACFHHRETGDRTGLFRVVESMLDLIDIHLETASINARMAAVKPIGTSVQWHQRHDFGLGSAEFYDIDFTFEDQNSTLVIAGRTNFEALHRAIDSLAADDRLKLLGIQVGRKIVAAPAVDVEDIIEAVTNFEIRTTLTGDK
ncbi:hypothetical protein [Rhizobium sp.]